MAEPLDTNCHRDYRAVHTSGRRTGNPTLIVMHDTEGGTAQSIARYFSTVASGGSAHLVIDDQTCYRCLDDNQIPWAAPGANLNGFHIEQCGYAKWTTVIWKLSHIRTLRRAAYKAAFHCKKFGIPPRFVWADGIRAGKKGITTHAEVTKAYPKLGSHTDPGPGWPRLLFMSLVKLYYSQL